mmetsp:Transcript_31502/g.94254  ORF Transcript_31502/g.94254 Transcript_31502/m.94254 type:complete len:498 (-) Transcript_31502:178-1671(-)
MQILQQQYRPLPHPPRAQRIPGRILTARGRGDRLSRGDGRGVVPLPILLSACRGGPDGRGRRGAPAGYLGPLLFPGERPQESRRVVLVQKLQRSDRLLGVAAARPCGGRLPPRPRSSQGRFALQKRPQHAGARPSGPRRSVLRLLGPPPHRIAHDVHVERTQAVAGVDRGALGPMTEEDPHQLLGLLEYAVRIPQERRVHRRLGFGGVGRVGRVHRAVVPSSAAPLVVLGRRGDPARVGEGCISAPPISYEGSVGPRHQEGPDGVHGGRALDASGQSGNFGAVGTTEAFGRFGAAYADHSPPSPHGSSAGLVAASPAEGLGRRNDPAYDGEVERRHPVGRVDVSRLLGMGGGAGDDLIPAAVQRRTVEIGGDGGASLPTSISSGHRRGLLSGGRGGGGGRTSRGGCFGVPGGGNNPRRSGGVLGDLIERHRLSRCSDLAPVGRSLGSLELSTYRSIRPTRFPPRNFSVSANDSTTDSIPAIQADGALCSSVLMPLPS